MGMHHNDASGTKTKEDDMGSTELKETGRKLSGGHMCGQGGPRKRVRVSEHGTGRGRAGNGGAQVELVCRGVTINQY